MNKTDISTDGVCVYVHSTIESGRGIKIFVRISLLLTLIGILLLIFKKTNSIISLLGLMFLLGGIIMILPMFRTILWNLYGEEYLSFSTKSIAQELSFGLFKLPRRTFEYDDRLKFEFETLRDENGIKEGLIHFYSYDKNNQPFHLFQTLAYITSDDYQDIISKLQLIFILENNKIFEYSLN